MQKGSRINKSKRIQQFLSNTFNEPKVKTVINHYSKSIKKFQNNDWEGCILYVGKFVEATLKTLYLYCGLTLPRPREFKVNTIVDRLKNLDANQYDDIIRLLIPRACVFIYDIASNRGARHDPTEIDSNKMDANVSIQLMSWVMAEMIRFSQKGSIPPEDALTLIETLIEKKYPNFEEINGRIYVNIEGLSAPEIGLLLLNYKFPNRIAREKLVDMIKRHGISYNNASVAVTRIIKYVDCDRNNNLKIRGLGRKKADQIQSEIQ